MEKTNIENLLEGVSPEERIPSFTLWEHIARYVFAAQFIEGKTILDIACGTGYGASYLMNKGTKMVVGADYLEQAIEYARLHYQKDGLYLLRSDAQQMPFLNSSFDVIVSFETIEHLERYEDFLRECKRVLKTNGIFICSTPNRDGRFGYKNPFHLREFSAEEFYELIARYFREVKLCGQGFLKKTDIVKRESIRRLGPIIRFIPKPIKDFLKRFIQPEQCLFTSLAEVCPNFPRGNDEIVEGKYIPSLLTQDLPLCRGMIAVARKRDE